MSWLLSVIKDRYLSNRNKIIKLIMMSSRISLLEWFSTCTLVMPYFGPTHKSFLLLSQLSKGSRKMLDEFFEEILNWLKENLVCLTIEYDFQIELMFLPANLFKFSIKLNTIQALESFVKLIERINNKKGYYFNENYMHNRLCIEKMYVYSNILSLKEEDIEFSQNTVIINHK